MALTFNGSSQFVHLADNSALTLQDGDCTIALWIKLTNNEGADRQTIWFTGTAYSATPFGNWRFYEAGSGANAGKLNFEMNDNDGTNVIASSTSTPGTSTAWQHLALVRSGNTITQYINAAADGSTTNANFDALDSGTGWWIGSQTGTTRFVNGAIEGVTVWNWALSAGQLAALAAGMNPERIRHGGAWRMPMRHGAREVWTGLTVTDNSGGLVAGPGVEDDLSSLGMSQAVQSAIAA